MTTTVERNAHRRRQIAFGRWAPWVDATGTIRRLNALTADGWSAQALADALGTSKATSIALRANAAKQGRVRRDTAEWVRDAYDRLWHVTPPGRYQERCERYAATRGWVASWRWEGRDMDDPTAEPEPLPSASAPDLKPCGTIAAARMHYRRGEPLCRACAGANRRDSAERKAAAA